MELLGSYSSSLTQFHYQELLAQLNQAIAAGDLSGGSAFDKSTLLTLEAQGQDFSSIPTATAGDRVTDDTFNHPIALLQGRLAAIASEVNNFTNVSGQLLEILAKETALIDSILAADTLQSWVRSVPQLLDAWSTSWDFSIGQGHRSLTVEAMDPANFVIYNSLPVVGSVFNTSNGNENSGLQPSSPLRSLPVKNLIWSYQTVGTPETLYGSDLTWAELNLLTDLPQVIYNVPPNVQVVLPIGGLSAGKFQVSGQVPGGTLPTYVRVLFHPRRNQITTTVSNGVVTTLTPYTIDPDNIQVWTGSTIFNVDTDFTVDQSGSITPLTIGTAVEVTIRFTENYPAYQCSMDQVNWSPICMLDPNRPYPDDETDFLPLAIENGMFPLTDETGVPTGLYFQLLSILDSDYTLLVSTPAASGYGPAAVLELDVTQPSYCNSINISPFAAFPAILTMVEVEGLASTTRHAIWSGSFVMENATQILFPRQMVTKIYLTFVQENYVIKQYQEDSPDALRRNTMNSLQSALPFPVQRTAPAVPIVYRGFQYEFGFEALDVLDVQPTLPCVYVQGPIVLTGCPNVIRLDAQVVGDVQIYICYRAYDVSGNLLDSNTSGILTNPGTAYVFPFTTGTILADIASTEFSFKFVMRDAVSIVSRYNLQATVR